MLINKLTHNTASGDEDWTIQSPDLKLSEQHLLNRRLKGEITTKQTTTEGRKLWYKPGKATHRNDDTVG